MAAPSAPPTPPPFVAPSLAASAPPPSDDSIRSLLSIARSLALLFAGLAALLFLVFLVLTFVEAILGRGAGDIVTVAYCAASAAVNFLIWRQLPGLQQAVAEGRYGAVREPLLVWAILGILFFVLVGVVLLIAWVKVEARVTPRTPS